MALQLDRAVEVIFEKFIAVSVNVYSSVLQACPRKKALAQALRVCTHFIEHGQHCSTFSGKAW